MARWHRVVAVSPVVDYRVDYREGVEAWTLAYCAFWTVNCI